MRRNIDLERYTLKLKTVGDYSKFLNLPLIEAKKLLLEQNVTPSLINKEKYLKLKETKSTEELAKYYHVSVSTFNKECAKQKVNKKLNSITRKDLLLYAYNGYTVQQLADKFNVAYVTMNALIKEYKIPITSNHNNRLDKKMVLRLLDKGVPIKEIAKRLGCTIQAIMYHAKGVSSAKT